MAVPSSIRSIPAIPRSTTICAFPISPTIAPTPQRPTATRGSRCRRLRRAAAAGRIGAVAPRFHGAPTNRSHRITVETDAPEILSRIRQDGADVALIVPNCPVCHQTSTLVARHLEANGIPTVVMGCAKDIVEHAAAPRFLFSDFPLGNSAGKPHDMASQDQTLELALRLLESAPGARTTMQSPLRWSADGEWKLDYLNLEQIGEAELKRLRQEFDRQKELARAQPRGQCRVRVGMHTCCCRARASQDHRCDQARNNSIERFRPVESGLKWSNGSASCLPCTASASPAEQLAEQPAQVGSLGRDCSAGRRMVDDMGQCLGKNAANCVRRTCRPAVPNRRSAAARTPSRSGRLKPEHSDRFPPKTGRPVQAPLTGISK